MTGHHPTDDPLDARLRALGHHTAAPPPPRSTLAAIARRDRTRRARTRLAAGALAVLAVVVAGVAGLSTLGTGDGSDDGDLATEGPGTTSRPAPCAAAGEDPGAGVALSGPAAVSDALEARYPTCFGGLESTGTSSAEIWVVGEDPAVLAEARELMGTGATVTMHPSDHALAAVRDLKRRIDAERADLVADGIPVQATGITVEARGPRVLVLVDPASPPATAALEQRYGADWLHISDPRQAVGS